MAAAGADALVAEGMESGGHIGESATLPLVAQVTAAVELPVLAAGGVADGRGLAAALMLGACGVQMGTAFLVAKECKISQDFKDRVLAADDTSTVVTGRRAKHAVRSLANQLTAKYQELEFNCAPVEELEALAAGSLRRAVEENDMAMGGLMAGQIAGLIRQEASAAQIITTIVQEAEALLLQAPAWVKE